MNVHELPTPALLLDRDIFETNVRAMARHVERAGKKLRPHAKAHKCVEIAKRQLAAGAVGVCAATVPEAELMVRSGITGVLLTSPVADVRKCQRIAALCSNGPAIAVVVDNAEQVAMYAEASENAGVKLDVLVDLDVGDHRTGIGPGESALELVQRIGAKSSLRFAGLQAYSVRASHMREDEGREEFSVSSLQVALETKDLLRAHGIEVEVVTGGSTGTYQCDASLPFLTELQSGSYALMDRAYVRVGGIEFGNALTVLATVISANHEDRVTVDAGFKAFSTDRPFGPEPADAAGVRFEWAGDEFGYLFYDHSSPGSTKLRLGSRVRLIPPHCDPTVNLYDCIHVCRGDVVEEIWPVMDRTAGRSLTAV